MKNILRAAIVDPNDLSRSAIKRLLLGIDTVWLEAECSHYDFFTDVVTQTQPDLAIVSLDADSEKALELVHRITSQLPECHVLVVSSSQEGSLILRAIRNGAREFLSYPIQIEEFLGALERIQHSQAGRSKAQTKPCQVMTVAGAGGGVGCTALAVNLACSFARKSEENHVVVVDLDLALGDADVWLDIVPDYTIQDVAENIERLDYSLLKRSLSKHETGVCLLPRPIQLDTRPSLSSEQLRRVLAMLKATFTHLIIDISKTYNPLDWTVIEASDLVLLITQLDLPCLRNVVRLVQLFEQHEGLLDKLRVIVNRMGLEDSEISLNKAAETIGREIMWQVPNDYATMVASRNNGIPLLKYAPRAKVTRSIDELAHALDPSEQAEGEQAEAKHRKKGLFSFFGG